MAIKLEEFSKLLTGIYDAGLGVIPWENVLNELVMAFGGNAAAMLVAKPDLRYMLVANVGANPEAVQSYNDYYGRFDIVANTIQHSSAGTVVCGRQIISPAERRDSMFYNEWVKPYEVGDGIAATLMQRKGSTSWIIITSPFHSRQSFGTANRVKLMQQLLPHIQQSLRIQMRVEEKQLPYSDTLGVLARLSHGVVLLSEKGRAVFINPAAEAILNQSDGLTIDKTGYLHVVHLPERTKLKKIIGIACKGNDQGLRYGDCVRIIRPSCRQDLFGYIVPLGTEVSDLTEHSASAMLLIIDPENDSFTPSRTLSELFNLTPAEIRVAIHTAKGGGLQYVADQLSISLSTARIHLQHVFEKTGTHRQADLTRLLLILHAGIDMDKDLK